MKDRWIVVCAVAALMLPVSANAQGVVGGAQQGAAQGAKAGNKAAGPVGGAVGSVVGGATGAVTGGVNSVLGVPQSSSKKKKSP
jgi:hypothetical protein